MPMWVLTHWTVTKSSPVTSAGRGIDAMAPSVGTGTTAGGAGGTAWLAGGMTIAGAGAAATSGSVAGAIVWDGCAAMGAKPGA